MSMAEGGEQEGGEPPKAAQLPADTSASRERSGRRRSTSRRHRRHRQRRRKKALKRALKRSFRWSVPVVFLAVVIAALVMLPEGKRARGPATFNDWTHKGDQPAGAQTGVTDDLAATADRWRQVLAKPDAGIAEYRALLDEDHRKRGMLVQQVGGLEQLAAKLLVLGQTNQSDLARLLRSCADSMDAGHAMDIARRFGEQQDPEARRWIAQALWVTGDMWAFDQVWGASPEAFAASAPAKPLRLAADALIREGTAAEGAKAVLAGMLKDPQPSPGVWHALALVAFQSGDIPGHRSLLEATAGDGERRLKDWMDHVDLMLDHADNAGISDVLDALPLQRGTPWEVIDAAKRLSRRGQHPHAHRLLERRLNLKLEMDPAELYVMAGFSALASKDWNGCKGHVTAMRLRASNTGSFEDVSHFLQGCAALGAGDDGFATECFGRMALGKGPQPEVLLRFLVEGIEPSAGVLDKAVTRQAWLAACNLEAALSGDSSYWRARSTLAGYASQVPDMVLAARTAMRIDPRSPSSVASLIRALLLSPDSKPEVLGLSARLMKEMPVLAEWRVQRATALAASNLPDDAKAILKPLKPKSIPQHLREPLRVAWLEVHVAAKEWDAARKAIAALPLAQPEPLLRARMDRLSKRIPKL